MTIEESSEIKTESSKSIYELLPDVKTALMRLYGQGKEPEAHVFTREGGGVMRPDTLTRSFQRLLRKNGFPKMRFHDLRHSTASILFSLGWSLEDVKNWLRHTDIETTSNIYLHYGRTRRIMVGNGLSGLFHVN